MEQINKPLSFRVSSGLKNIIGRNLISDRYIAVFELVKNSYDAGASNVRMTFQINKDGLGQIIISDNGCGMTYDDIIQKWLFVAYSEKKPENRKKSTFRENIKREIAGAKGVGRFSCDRLGETLRLVTKTENEIKAHVVDVDWNRFESDDTKEFVDIPVDYSQMDSLPNSSPKGTTLIVDKIREPWDRESLLKLKRSLMKLISPDANKGELPFEIEMIVPSEKEKDANALKKKGINPDRDIVNGIIHNDIFEKLNIKTTNIELIISEDGQLITSKLSDRGQYIFTVEEKNKNYRLLKDIHISIFYLNRSAKTSFTRQMGGVQPLKYGSVFIYKNGFRINPYGEPGQDFLGIDQRKAQGWKRFLGTREIMGRISIKGENDQFVETTSRAHGFIQNDSFDMLADLFKEKVLKVLEKYVVNLIGWGEPLKSDPSHIITPDEIGEQIISQFITNIDSDNIISVDYNPDLLKNDTSLIPDDNIVSSLAKLETMAVQTKDSGLLDLAQSVRKRTETILSHNLQLEEEKERTEKELGQARLESKVREKQVYFLKGAANQDVTNLLNGFHTIYALTDAIKGNVDYLRRLLNNGFDYEKGVYDILGEIYQATEKARKLSDLAIHGNQVLKQDEKGDIYEFIRQYINAGLVMRPLTYTLVPTGGPRVCQFDVSSIGIIIDNVASNSRKAGASELKITIEEASEFVKVYFDDNGGGLAANINPDKLFEWGYSVNTSSKGFGIGLFHIKQLVDEMQGAVTIDTGFKGGFRLVVDLKK